MDEELIANVWKKNHELNNRLRFWTATIDCGRMGEISGSFLATQAEMDSLIGKSLYLDDVLGKHSEFNIEIKDLDIFKEIDLSEACITELKEKVGSQIGGFFNPFDCIDA